MKVSYSYKSPNDSSLHNFSFRDIIVKGVYVSPVIIGNPSTSSVTINPGWVIRSADGMTVSEEAIPITLTLSGQGSYYVGVDAQFIVGTRPLIEIKSTLVSDYNSWSVSQKNSFIIFAQVLVTVNGATTTIQIDDTQSTRPRGIFALQEDLDSKISSLSIQVVSRESDLSDNMNVNELVYIEDTNSLAIFLNGTNWYVIDKPLFGSSKFSPLTGTNILIPGSVPSTIKNTNNYCVTITQTSYNETGLVGGAHTGEIWVLKGKKWSAGQIVSDPNYFCVRCSGEVPDYSSSDAVTFDWVMHING